MPLVSMRQVLDEAAKGGYGVGAFNVNNMEQLQGIVDAAVETNSPVIVQASAVRSPTRAPNYLRHLIIAASESAPEIPIVLHLDHGDKPETCFIRDRARFHQRDDGRLAAGRRQDAGRLRLQRAVTREVVELAHARGRQRRGRARHAGRDRGRRTARARCT